MQSYQSALCVHSRLANVLLRFNLDNKFQRGGGTESYVREQTLENQSRQLPESALLSSRSPHWTTREVLRASISLVWVICWLTPLTVTTVLSGRLYYTPTLDSWGN